MSEQTFGVDQLTVGFFPVKGRKRMKYKLKALTAAAATLASVGTASAQAVICDRINESPAAAAGWEAKLGFTFDIAKRAVTGVTWGDKHADFKPDDGWSLTATDSEIKFRFFGGGNLVLDRRSLKLFMTSDDGGFRTHPLYQCYLAKDRQL
jgi:hypothetical protein